MRWLSFPVWFGAFVVGFAVVRLFRACCALRHRCFTFVQFGCAFVSNVALLLKVEALGAFHPRLKVLHTCEAVDQDQKLQAEESVPGALPLCLGMVNAGVRNAGRLIQLPGMVGDA